MNTKSNNSLPDAIPAALWPLLGLASFAIRLVLGWTYWGGASRRLIYDQLKLDPSSHAYLANKLVHAAPGAAFDITPIMHWLLHQPTLLHIAIISFTLLELIVGVGLMLGFATRILSIGGMGLAIVLMIIFGWMGTTCLDEWTMAATGFAMAAVTFITGGGWYSLDRVFFGNNANQSAKLAWLTSGPLPLSGRQYVRFSTIMAVISIVFTVGFYGYNFGALVTPLGKRVNNVHPSIALSQGTLQGQTVKVNTYMITGPDTQGVYITHVAIDNGSAQVASYSSADLKQASQLKLTNEFAPYSTCKAVDYAVRCQLGSKATWQFQLPKQTVIDTTKPVKLVMTDVEGKQYQINLKD
ncbi:TQO small subunit DoxD [Celerinatantimonas diazotrophica]|uniref:Thiosulfate dehydrogenase [quinone] large subunit n=1 Tax=Celerinatantimonas diazotrophica TaxID=412034 RepID=A0A4V2PPR9_9GAMM|nr:TQO small subunit DoxD [Celerinatantimonas diazotrophica]TCK52071.1 thiosulfate dehydrogenase [quinone] large subunit [Celerinatantimonas diazotrophica]CAG9296226.1 hypothetical protein CEDIAZO_01374 [Celerinatantimonas diazotrophica]